MRKMQWFVRRKASFSDVKESFIVCPIKIRKTLFMFPEWNSGASSFCPVFVFAVAISFNLAIIFETK